jgi:hypothetical protein
MTQFEDGQRERRANLVRTFLIERVRHEIRAAVRAAVQRELSDLKIVL